MIENSTDIARTDARFPSLPSKRSQFIDIDL